MTTYRTEYTPSGQLETGMIVHDHGSRFELLGRVEDSRNENSARTGFKAFYTKYLGPTFKPEDEAIPAHWRTESRPWIIQGNNLAYWSVETLIFP